MNQTYSFTELIIVDDGSSDQTVDIVKKLISSNSSIRLIEKSEISYNDSGKKLLMPFIEVILNYQNNGISYVSLIQI